jgi:hypothetical protein
MAKDDKPTDKQKKSIRPRWEGEGDCKVAFCSRQCPNAYDDGVHRGPSDWKCRCPGSYWRIHSEKFCIPAMMYLMSPNEGVEAKHEPL